MSTFSDIIGALNGGTTHLQLAEALKAVCEGVRLTHKTGEITLKLKITPNGENAVTITDDIKAKVPENGRGASVFFIDNTGNLTRRDPRQAELFREVIDPETGASKRVS